MALRMLCKAASGVGSRSSWGKRKKGDKVSPSRQLAIWQLTRVEADEAHVARLSNDDSLSESDKAHANLIVRGVTKWKRRIDTVLAEHANKPLETMDVAVLCTLRACIFEVEWLSTPKYASVNEAVAAAREVSGEGAASYANGVLRAALRALERKGWPKVGKSREVQLANEYSVPDWLARSWVHQFGERQTSKLLAAANGEPCYAVRPAKRRTSMTLPQLRRQLTSAGLRVRKSNLAPDNLRVEGSCGPLRELLEEGVVALQDEAAASVVHFLAPKPGDHVIDVCAAPGGKILYAAEMLEGKGSATALDKSASKLGVLKRTAEAQGLGPLVMCHEMDARSLPAKKARKGSFDKVLVDAPCSGTGALAKRADLRWRRLPEELDQMTKLQNEILDASAKLVKPGGVLVYSTCSLQYEENEMRALSFLERHNGDFSLCDASHYAPNESLSTEDGFLFALPHVHSSDGAFAARFFRNR